MTKMIVRLKKDYGTNKSFIYTVYIYIYAIDTVCSHEIVPSLENHDEIQSCGEACDESVCYDWAFMIRSWYGC